MGGTLGAQEGVEGIASKGMSPSGTRDQHFIARATRDQGMRSRHTDSDEVTQIYGCPPLAKGNNVPSRANRVPRCPSLVNQAP